MRKSFAVTIFCLVFFRLISICYLRDDSWGRHLDLVGERQVPEDSIFFSCKAFIQCCKGVETERWQGQPMSEGQIWTKRKTQSIITSEGEVLMLWDEFSVFVWGKGPRWCVLSVSKKIKLIPFLITEAVFWFFSPTFQCNSSVFKLFLLHREELWRAKSKVQRKEDLFHWSRIGLPTLRRNCIFSSETVAQSWKHQNEILLSSTVFIWLKKVYMVSRRLHNSGRRAYLFHVTYSNCQISTTSASGLLAVPWKCFL